VKNVFNNIKYNTTDVRAAFAQNFTVKLTSASPWNINPSINTVHVYARLININIICVCVSRLFPP